MLNFPVDNGGVLKITINPQVLCSRVSIYPGNGDCDNNFAGRPVFSNLLYTHSPLMIVVKKRALFFIIPALFFIIQCDNSSSHAITTIDSSAVDEDTLHLAGASAADAITSAAVNNALVFHINDSMQTGKGYKATLALGKNLSLEDLKEEVRESVNSNTGKLYTDTTLKVAAEMRARLKELNPAASKSFEITPLGEDSEIQEINEETSNKAFWQWNLVPLKEGRHELELVIEIVLNKKRNIFLPSRTIPVTIYSTPESFGTKFSSFMDKNWQWMVTAVLIPIFIAWLTTRIRQRQQQSVPAKIPEKKKKRK
ncbi:MAG: hypothetical protein WDO19_31470 [Bacteroidota bacterium]